VFELDVLFQFLEHAVVSLGDQREQTDVEPHQQPEQSDVEQQAEAEEKNEETDKN